MDRNRKIIVTLLVVLGITLGTSALFAITIYPVTDYGDIRLFNGRTNTGLSEGDTLDVQSGDTLKVWLEDDRDTMREPNEFDFSAWLKLGSTTIEKGDRDDSYPPHYLWLFDLTACPTGINTYHVYFFAQEGQVIVKGDSFTFTIKNGEAPAYEDAEIVLSPEGPVNIGVDALISLRWKFIYDGPCDGYVTSDSVEVQRRSFGVSTGERTFDYLINTSIAGTQELVFTVEPDADDNLPVVSDPVTVIVEGEIPTTTTTPTDTTTTTTTTEVTTTTTTDEDEPPGEEPPSNLVILGVAVAGAVLILLIVRRRG